MNTSGFSYTFWIVFQIAIDGFLVLFVLWLMRHMKTRLKKNLSREITDTVIGRIEPLLRQADQVAATVDQHLREKQRLVNRLNNTLDARIISLNLLLNRTEAIDANDSFDPETQAAHVYDQQESIVQLFNAGKPSTEISRILSIPRGEVDLVLDLKKKLLTIE